MYQIASQSSRKQRPAAKAPKVFLNPAKYAGRLLGL